MDEAEAAEVVPSDTARTPVISGNFSRISSGTQTASVIVSPPMKKAQEDRPFVHAWEIPDQGSYNVAFAAPPFGMKVCSMKRVGLWRPISPLKMWARPVSVY